jgi:hypothetical protein
MVSIRKVLGVFGVVGLMAVTAAPALASKAAPAASLASPQSVSLATVSNPNGHQTFGSVQCPVGSLRTGGGVFGFSGFAGGQQTVNSSYPSGNGWAAYMNNATGFNSSFIVYAVCLS